MGRMKCTKDQAEKCKAEGMTYEEIGEKYGISKQRVYQILSNKPKPTKKPKHYPNGLQAARIAKGIETTEIAERYGKTKSWVSKLEHGEMTIKESMYTDLCKLYGVDKIEGLRIRGRDKEYIEQLEETIKKLEEKNAKLQKKLENENANLKFKLKRIKELLGNENLN